MKFYTSVVKGLKLIVRKFCGLSLTFVEVTGEKLVGVVPFCLPPPIKRHRLSKKKDVLVVFVFQETKNFNLSDQHGTQDGVRKIDPPRKKIPRKALGLVFFSVGIFS